MWVLLAVAPPRAPRGPATMSLAPEQREWTPPHAGDRPEAAEMLSRLTPGTLAYLGDAVYEQSVRERLLWASGLCRGSTASLAACSASCGQRVA